METVAPFKEAIEEIKESCADAVKFTINVAAL